jgi:hypothetical protein
MRSYNIQLYGIDAENREPPTNQPNNQQPSGREQPVDSRCLQSGSERIRVEWLHLVKRQLIMTRRLTSAEPKKVNKDLFSEAYEVRRGLVARSRSSRRAIWNEFVVDNQSSEWPMRSSSIQLRGIDAENRQPKNPTTVQSQTCGRHVFAFRRCRSKAVLNGITCLVRAHSLTTSNEESTSKRPEVFVDCVWRVVEVQDKAR